MVLGLLPVSAQAAALNLPAKAGTGKTVAVLGAGLSGLCTQAGIETALIDPGKPGRTACAKASTASSGMNALALSGSVRALSGSVRGPRPRW